MSLRLFLVQIRSRDRSGGCTLASDMHAAWSGVMPAASCARHCSILGGLQVSFQKSLCPEKIDLNAFSGSNLVTWPLKCGGGRTLESDMQAACSGVMPAASCARHCSILPSLSRSTGKRCAP